MEAHIVTAVGPGEAPKEWGCDAVWEGGDPVLEKCIAVFGVMYVMKKDVETPPALKNLINAYPKIAGTSHPNFSLLSACGSLDRSRQKLPS